MSVDCVHIQQTSGSDCQLHLRLPGAFLDDLRRHADAQGETLSDFCRRALRLQMQRDTLTARLQASRNAFKDGVWADLHARHPKGKE